MDTNVDPPSTMQVVNALIKADKISICWWCRAESTVPDADEWTRRYGQRRQYDFFIQHSRARGHRTGTAR